MQLHVRFELGAVYRWSDIPRGVYGQVPFLRVFFLFFVWVGRWVL